MNLQAAVDVGGTFTDLTVQQDGVLRFTKVPTTPARIHEGVLGALEQAEIDLAGVERLVHGSTIVINTIIQRSGARTALVTTKGFGDVLEIGRANRPDMYNFRYQKPVPFVPRERCFEVSGRLDAAGRLVEPLDDAALDELVASIAASGAEAVAVCTLHSYANPEHEAAIADRLRVELPVSVSASHEISSLWREYERASTTVLNAYAHPAVSTYLGRLESDLEGRGFGAPFNLVQSSGGLTDAHDARVRPVTLVESGPVAGVAGSARLGDALGVRDVISFDVGGTTAKCAVIKDGRLPITDDYAIEHSHRFPGYPVQVPTVDIVEISAGGGSLARATAEGSVRVGPESAGASPGPACYGWGGDQPTVNDAALLAGWLDPDYFLGGRMRLHPGAAEAAVRDLSEQVGLSVDETAAGILRLAHEGLAGALRLVTLEQGHDPRDFVLCASGGAGPMHAALLARDLGIGRVLVPPSAGTFSAWAMLLLDRRADAAVTKLVALDDYDAAVFEELRAVAAARLGAAVEKDERVVAMRYRGQEHTLEVVVPEEAALDDLAGRFHSAHHARFGFSLRDNDMECVSFRVAVFAAAERASLPSWPTRDGAFAASHRRVAFGDEVVERTRVYVRASLGAGARLDGPAVVEEETSTALVPPETRSEVDRFGNLVIEVPA